MNKKKVKNREIWQNDKEMGSDTDDGGCRRTNTDYQIKKYKGPSLFSLKFLWIVILLYFIRINEAHTINPHVAITRNGDLMGGFSDLVSNQNSDVEGKDEFNRNLDKQLEEFVRNEMTKRKHGSDEETSSTDSSSSDTDDEDNGDEYVSSSEKASSVGDQNLVNGSDSEPVAPEAKKVLAQPRNRNFVYDGDFTPDPEVKASRPFARRLARPLQSNSKRVFKSDGKEDVQIKESKRQQEEKENDEKMMQTEYERMGARPKQTSVKEKPVGDDLNDVSSVRESVSLIPSEETGGKDDGDNSKEVLQNEQEVVKNEDNGLKNSQEETTLEEELKKSDNKGEREQNEEALKELDNQEVLQPVQNVEPVQQEVPYYSKSQVVEDNNLGSLPDTKVNHVEHNTKTVDKTEEDKDQVYQEEVQNQEPKQPEEETVPVQEVVKNEDNGPVNKSEFDEFGASEQASSPPQSVFRTTVKQTIPNDVSFLGGKNGRVAQNDDFDLKEVESIDVDKLDSHITQQVDNAWLRKQKQNQMIGTQIPLATSYEYNRSAHVLEPKFESPKVIGGIIQTLTDKESKLRRADKRKLKIQHDLNLYISKESAAVVNMLNNGEVNRLQKMHPLVYMRLQEVFHTQYALDNLVRKDGDKVKRYDKNWYLNSSPTVKASFIEEIRKYSKEPELYGKFKKPKKIKESREGIYNKLELFHNDYICQRIVRENQYAEKVLRSLEQQSGLYLAPFYHNIVPGLGSLWLMKNFERYFMEAFRSKATTFGKIAPTLVGRFMLMVENGTVLPSTPSSQVAIHALTIMLSHIMDGVKEPRTFLGKRKFYGFMSLCDTKCVDRIFEEKDSKSHMTLRQIEFLRWVLAFHSEDLLLVDTYAQKVVLNNMYAVTREDIYRTSPKNIQLRIQSEFSVPKRGRRPSFLELVGNGDNSFLQQNDSSSSDTDDEDNGDLSSDGSMLELENELSANYEGRIPRQTRGALRDHEEKLKRQYRKMQLERLLEDQIKESKRQQEEKENDMFQKAMREREAIIRRSQENYNKPRVKDGYKEKALFVKEDSETLEKDKKQEKDKGGEIEATTVYENVKNKLENLGSTYRVFLKRFMSGYHAPGKDVDVEATSDSIVPFYVFVPFNKPTGGYDNQFLDVVQILTDLVNLAYKDFNVYFHTLNTFLMIRTMHSALHSFESSKTKSVSSSRTMGSLFRWLNTDSNRYLSHVPKKYLPFTSLSLQLVFFFQELVENYSNKVFPTLKSFFRGIVKFNVGRSTNRPMTFAKLNDNLEPSVIYQANKYRASLDALEEMVKLFKNTFISKPSIPSPVIQYISVFAGLWAQVDSETFDLSDRGTHKARKMFLLSFLSNHKSLAEMATEMILKNCAGLKMLHLGCVFKTTSEERDCNQISVKLKKKKILHIMRVLESTSLDPLDVVRIASDTCRRCVANLKVRPHVGAPVMSYLEMSEESAEEMPEAEHYLGSDTDDEDNGDLSSDGSKSERVSMINQTPKESKLKEYDDDEKGETPVDPNKHWYDFIKKNPFKKNLTPEEEALLLPHFVDRLMLHSEITHRVHCYVTQKALVKSLLSALGSAKDEVDVRQIITNVFGEYRTIEVIQAGMASSIHRLICPYMVDAQDSVRIPLQANIIKYVVNKLANKSTPNVFFKDLFKGLLNKIDLLVPSPEGYHLLHDLPGCVFVGSREYNGVYYSGGYAPFSKIDKPTNIMLKPGEGRLVYDGDNFVPELTALQDVSDLETINVVHERDFDRIVYQVRGDGGPVMMTERGFALEHPNFVVRAHVLVTAKALLRMGFDMGRIIWCGDRYGWVADFVLKDVVPLSDVPVYNGQYWLLTSQLNVKDVVGTIPVRFLNEKFRNTNVIVNVDEDEEHLPDKNINELNVEITARGKKVGEIKAHGSGVEDEVEMGSDQENEATELLIGSGGDSMSATPGAVKSVRSATFNPVGHKLTLDLDMPDFVFGQ